MTCPCENCVINPICREKPISKLFSCDLLMDYVKKIEIGTALNLANFCLKRNLGFKEVIDSEEIKSRVTCIHDNNWIEFGDGGSIVVWRPNKEVYQELQNKIRIQV